MRRLLGLLMRDPRHGQIVALSLLIAAGIAAFDWEMPLWRPCVAVTTAFGTQFLAARLVGIPFEARSALITAGSLTLLLRTEGWLLVALGAALAIASKFVLRIDGRHIWNPAALAIALVTALSPSAWVAPGQWGTEAWLLLLAAGAGTLVTARAHRAEVPLVFLAAWACLSVARALWLGDPIAIPLHQLQSGALVIFAFFMISDPMSQPNHHHVRVLWVCLVAGLGFWLQHSWIVTAGPLWGLVLAGPLVPLLDRLWPGRRPTWRRRARPLERKGVFA